MPPRPPAILALDFDGVVGDGMREYFATAWMAFSPLLLLMSIMSLLGASVWNITTVFGIAFGIQHSRIIRGVRPAC